MAKDPKEGRKIITQNREARHRFEILEVVEAGIVLTGTEVKAIRTGKMNVGDAYAYIKNGECFLAHLHIPEYTHGNRENHNPLRERKLLLRKEQIHKLQAAIQEKGRTLVPLELHFSKGRVKVELGIGRGKKLHDKRESLKERSVKKELAQITKRSAKR